MTWIAHFKSRCETQQPKFMKLFIFIAVLIDGVKDTCTGCCLAVQQYYMLKDNGAPLMSNKVFVNFIFTWCLKNWVLCLNVKTWGQVFLCYDFDFTEPSHYWHNLAPHSTNTKRYLVQMWESPAVLTRQYLTLREWDRVEAEVMQRYNYSVCIMATH